MENYALVIAGISALIALVAVIVGPLVSLHIAKRQFLVSLDIAKRQFNASVLSVNRQEWINTLRDQLAELLADTILLLKEMELSQQEPDRVYARARGVLTCANKIQLLLNPKEADHRQLVDSIGRLTGLVNKPEDVDSQFKIIRNEIMSKSQEILKREWERVKEGE